MSESFKCVANKSSKTMFIIINIDTENDSVDVVTKVGTRQFRDFKNLICDNDDYPILYEVQPEKLTEIQISNYKAFIEQDEASAIVEEIFKTDLSYCEFYVTKRNYDQFIMNGHGTYQIIVSGGAKHPEGEYLIPKKVLMNLIRSWVRSGDIDWIANGKHSSSTVPTSLDLYWNSKKKIKKAA